MEGSSLLKTVKLPPVIFEDPYLLRTITTITLNTNLDLVFLFRTDKSN